MRPHTMAWLQVAGVFGLAVGLILGGILLTRDLPFGILVGGATIPMALGFAALRSLQFRWVDRAQHTLRDLVEERGGAFEKRPGSDLCRARLDSGVVVELCTTRDYWALEATATDPWTRFSWQTAPRRFAASMMCREGEPLALRWADGDGRVMALDPVAIQALTALEGLVTLPLQLEWDTEGAIRLYAPGWIREPAQVRRLLDEGLSLASVVAERLGGVGDDAEE